MFDVQLLTALPFVWFASFGCKKVTSQFIPGAPGGALVYNYKSGTTKSTKNTNFKICVDLCSSVV